MKEAQIEEYPYYYFIESYSIDNKTKCELGERAFAGALPDFPLMMNVTYGKRQKDIDHLVFAYDSVIMNECKNTKEGFFIWYSWFSSHVIDRFADGLPVAQFYAHTAGHSTKNVAFTLTIPKLDCEPSVVKAIKGLKIHVIETLVQLLRPDDKPLWYEPVRTNILSVINSIQVNTRYSADSDCTSCPLLACCSVSSEYVLPAGSLPGRM